MSRMKRTESVGDSACPVCHDPSEIYAIGPCDHPICYRCSTRMRVLCNQMYCPICRGELPQIVFLTSKRKYDEVNRRDCIPNRKYKILLEDESVEDAYTALLEFRCRVCDRYPKFDSFASLSNHMRREHTLFACDLCLNHLQIFPFERKFYNRKDLATHRRTGDADNRSYRGHPLCRFCDERYMDNDELHRHLRKSHEFCHFCDATGSNEYYNDYADLKEHFRAEHFLCEEGECGSKQTRLTHAFSSDIDLKAHIAAEHTGNKSRAQVKELRTIDVNFQMAPRRRGRDTSMITPEDYEEVNSSMRSQRDRRPRRNEGRYESHSRPDTATPHPPPAETPVSAAPPPPAPSDFPSLGNAPPKYIPAAIRKKPEEDFPTLSSQRQAAPANVVNSSSSIVPGATRQSASKPAAGSKGAVNKFSSIAAVVTSANSAPPAPAKFTSSTPTLLTSAKPRSAGGAAPRMNGEDFPTLAGKPGGGRAGGMSVGAWTRPQQTPQPRPAPNSAKQAPATQPLTSLTTLGRSLCDDRDFPSLGGGKSGAGQMASWVQNPAPTKGKGAKASTPLGNTRVLRPANLKEPEEHYNPLINDNLDFSDKNKTEETKAKKKKKKEKRKEEDKSTATEDSGISLSSIASEIDASFQQSPAEVKDSWEEHLQTPAADKNLSSKEAAKDAPKNVTKTETPNNENNSMGSNSVPEKDDGFSSGSSSQETEEKENENWTTAGSKKSPAFQEADFPSLQPKKKSQPPPGFSKTSQKASPPGLKKAVSESSWTRAPPPGLGRCGLSSATTGLSSAVVGLVASSLPMSVKLGLFPYLPLPDSAQRNRELVARVRQLLESREGGFDEFRALSAEFRGDQIGAEAYYAGCLRLLGREGLAGVLGELVVQLPDIRKQHQLWGAHPSLPLLPCPTCQQLIALQDVAAHSAAHLDPASLPTSLPLHI